MGRLSQSCDPPFFLARVVTFTHTQDMGPAPKDIENLETPLNTEEQDEEECLD